MVRPSPTSFFIRCAPVRVVTCWRSEFWGMSLSERATLSRAHTTAIMIHVPCSSVFIYGTLMAPQVLKGLIGRVPDLVEPAILSNYRRHPVKEHVFPGIIPCSTGASKTQGLLLEGLSENELKVLDWYEGEEYIRRDVKVKCDGISHETQCYVWSNRPLSALIWYLLWSLAPGAIGNAVICFLLHVA